MLMLLDLRQQQHREMLELEVQEWMNTNLFQKLDSKRAHELSMQHLVACILHASKGRMNTQHITP